MTTALSLFPSSPHAQPPNRAIIYLLYKRSLKHSLLYVLSQFYFYPSASLLLFVRDVSCQTHSTYVFLVPSSTHFSSCKLSVKLLCYFLTVHVTNHLPTSHSSNAKTYSGTLYDTFHYYYLLAHFEYQVFKYMHLIQPLSIKRDISSFNHTFNYFAF